LINWLFSHISHIITFEILNNLISNNNNKKSRIPNVLVFHHNKQYITHQFFPNPWSHASKTKSKWFFSGSLIHFLVFRTFRLSHDHNIPHFLNSISLPHAPSLTFFSTFLCFEDLARFHAATPSHLLIFFLKVNRKFSTVFLYLLNLEYFDHSFQREQITHGDGA
jgi:hypothetical protein